MRSNYKPLVEFIREVNKRDIHVAVEMLLGVSIQKKFIPSIANIIGTDMSTYKIIKRNQFAYGPVTSRNGDRISIALLDTFDEAIVSQSYTVFEVMDIELLLPEYLMMWFRRPEFDRYARFKSHGSAREVFDWEEMCKVELPIPSIEKQREIVTEYGVLINRINLNNSLIEKLEDTAQALYKQWFVDKIDLENLPEGWELTTLKNLVDNTKGGDWGKSEESGNYIQEVLCVRGTDIPNFQLGMFGDAPSRFIPKKNCQEKALEAGQIVMEISGGSPTQSTGRSVLISSEHINNSSLPIICSNFCKVLILKDKKYAHLIYSFIKALYIQNYLFNYENSTIGLKNFDLEGFLSQENIILPPNDILILYTELNNQFMKNIFTYGKENESLGKMKDLILAKMASVG